jgi:hypothetical protein
MTESSGRCSQSNQSCLLGTGVFISVWPNPHGWLREIDPTSTTEYRSLLGDIEAGRAVLVGCEIFAETRRGADVVRLCGTSTGPEPISLERDPTRELLTSAYRVRDAHLGELMRELRPPGFVRSRWELFAAPFRIELAREARLLLGGALGIDLPK